ncbi:MAG: M20/M25/M40 family metallo-hydrolase [Bacteroidia bacterium]|nr:M20/M25/M40 family metallo-hydrolase [Bacteroidia bacterium]NNF30976.1 M20/M25/M40 family metallo-hydrolase [Flavobacteriaceae bacterium]MBT8274938.1 M20/M25/M40 family metallo-hydrolase [Bacteroidia bacterium]NNJ82621.1 M20/M25/M40 family metallo-hydrolase [Flavobacteriaceae bacterium]NNK53137.1 M20/M25/M40 family metallo-hydrolase [Flavobacteriaceae bacterium]
MKRLSAVASLLIILGLIYYSFSSLMPSERTGPDSPETEFSTSRALATLKEISKAPHYYANEEHTRVREFLINEMQKMGLEVETQKDYVLSPHWGRQKVGDSVIAIPAGYHMDQPRNIMARLKGSGDGKALILLSHYDSAKVPSFGASDAGSGIVTILECLRAYQASGKTPANDIIILFTDAEEIGLDGAKLFVNNHPWAKDAALVLNFEARGSGGPSNMILETNGGNANLVKAFIEASPEYPVASSLMYSIYKMLPNDTDSTIFREDGDIDSFFFAFIDDHFDYHSANDTVENLDVESLQHQGSYLLPLLHYFSDADLQYLKASEDHVYVNVPLFKMIHYPFSWILPMLILAILIFAGLIFYGIKQGDITGKGVGRSFAATFISLVICGLLGFFGWKLLLSIYPEYNEIQHGFKYNGHSYIAFFVLISLAVTFGVFRRFGKDQKIAGMYIAPLTIWMLINILVYVVIKGAGYFIIPFFFGLISLWILIRQDKPNLLLMALITAPAIILFAPLVQFFPVGLGSDHVFISCIFTVLLFGLVYSVIGFYKAKRWIALLCLIVGLGYFIQAHNRSDFSDERQKPNSLIYYQNADKGKSYWVTYDRMLDDWTKGYLGESPEAASKYLESASGSKYNTPYRYASEAPQKQIASSEIILRTDSLNDRGREVSFTIRPKRKVTELFVFSDTTNTYSSLKFNGVEAVRDDAGTIHANVLNKRLMRYFMAEDDSLNITYSTPDRESYEFTILEFSFDLMDHPQFTINKRPAHMMPKPFVITDAIAVKRSFNINELTVKTNDTLDMVNLIIEEIDE